MAKLVASGAVLSSTANATSQAGAALPQLVRHMGGAPSGHAPETPLSKVMPPLVALPRQVVSTALGLTCKLVSGAAQSGAVKSAVTSFADQVLMKEQFVKLGELDVAYWSFWLSTSGYTSQAGFKRLAAAAVPRVASMEPQQVADLVVGFHKAAHYDRALFDAVAENVAANFTKFETHQLLPMLNAFAEFNHYSPALFDDIGDSIAYCNHYLAPMKAPTCQVAKALGAYAKFSHERADVFVTLARGISEVGLGELSAEARRNAVVTALRALKKFNFYPEQVDALLYYTESESSAYSADELSDAAAVKAAAEAQAGGKLAVYTPNAEEDAAHWYAHQSHGPAAGAGAQLYALRDNLVPKSYSPAGFRRN